MAEVVTMISRYEWKILKKSLQTVGGMINYEQGGSLGFWLALPNQPGRGH